MTSNRIGRQRRQLSALIIDQRPNTETNMIDMNKDSYYIGFRAYIIYIYTSRVWSLGDNVSRIDNDISSSCVSFCLPKATAPLVTIIHSRPSKWHSATCSTIDANRPSAKPLLSSRVMTALPNLITKRRAYFNWLRSEKVFCCCSPNGALRLSWFN